MASLATANLPSSDEEDDDYDPSMDPTGEKEPGQQGQTAGRKRGRGAAGGTAAADADANDDDDDTQLHTSTKPHSTPAAAADGHDDIVTPAQAAKKARISAMFEQLHESCTGSANKLSKSNISLASLCSNTDPKKKKNTDLLWMRNLGITPGTSHQTAKQHSSNAANLPQDLAAPARHTSATAAAGQQAPATAPPAVQTAAPAAAVAAAPAAVAGAAGANGTAAVEGTPAAAAADGGGKPDSEEQQHQQQQQQQQAELSSGSIRAAAAAALAAAREAASGGVGKSYNKITVTETRRFAGKDIEVTVEVDKDSKEAKKAAERKAAAATGLDAFLSQIEGKKKVSVLDKSKMDWQDFKSTDVDVQEELEAHRRSDKQYLDKQDFLKRAELREYEIERDKRLASDVRLRGRL